MRAYRIALRPSRQQRSAFAQHAGAARWAYNWGLARKKAAHAAGEKVPSAIELHRELNRLKGIPKEEGGIPWAYEVSKCAFQEGLRDLDAAFKRFFEGRRSGQKVGFPRFKSKEKAKAHFRLTGTIRVELSHLQLPRIGRVRIAPGERLYVPAALRCAQVSLVQEHGRWFASVTDELPEPEPVPRDAAVEVGIDLGVRKLAVLSDGTPPYENPRALRKVAARLRRAQRALSRSKKGSERQRKKKQRLARLHGRVRNLRQDAIHKATTDIARRLRVVGMEELQVKNMTRSARGSALEPGKRVRQKAGLNRSMLDASLGEFRRQLEYKMRFAGGRIVFVNPAWTSRRCSGCGSVNDPGSSERYSCAACGLRIDRDLNAARNIKAAAEEQLARAAASCSEAENARGAGVRPGGVRTAGQSASKRVRKRTFSHG